MLKQEEQIHIALSEFIQLQYPSVMFTTESSGLRLPIRPASILKKCRNPKVGWCDMIILEARGGYHGLLIEIKKDANEVLKKTGEMRTDKHNSDQFKFSQLASKKNYLYQYACGLDQGISVITYYMSLPPTSTI